MNILTFSTLYPNSAQPQFGVFVEQRLRQLLRSHPVHATVVAPVPWFPFSHPAFGKYARFNEAPAREDRHGITVWHPRYPLLPKIGMSSAPLLLAGAVKPLLKRLISSGHDFDVVDAHYFYPDGVAAALLARALRKPLLITARGTDINLIPKYRLPRKMIQWAAAQASGIVTVCEALKDELVRLDADGGKITVLRNGVDLNLFRPVDRQAVRERLGLKRTTLISVGHLVKRKGHDLIIGALPDLPDIDLLIAGEGEEDGALRSLARSLGVDERVRFVGAIPQAELREYYGAADVLVLASDREGWANVLLEAMACGTPVAATDVWGTPEVVSSPAAGVLIRERNSHTLAQAVQELLANPPPRSATRAYAEQFSWDDTSRGLFELFNRVAPNPTSADARMREWAAR